MTTPPSYPGPDPNRPDPWTGGQPAGAPGQYPPPGQYVPPGQYSPYPPGTVAVPDKPPVPASVNIAFLIFLVDIVVVLLTVLLTLNSAAFQNALNDATLENVQGVSVDTAIRVAKVTVIVAGVVVAGLYLLFDFKMRSGRNWARIVLTIIAALWLLSRATVRTFSFNNRTYEYTSGVSGIVGWGGAILAILAIIFMYTGPSNEYFRAMKIRKAVGYR